MSTAIAIEDVRRDVKIMLRALTGHKNLVQFYMAYEDEMNVYASGVGMALATLCAVAGLLGPVIEVAKLIAAPVRRQFSYLCCFSSNVDTLRDEARKLDDETRGLQMRVDAATNNAQLILPQVETWLTNSDEMINETNGILDEALNVGNGCWKFGERYSLSRKAKKKSRVIKELVEWCNFSNVSHPPPIAATAPLASGTTAYEFDSRREIEGEIMKALESKDVHKIGICGMGGVGKTTMVQMMMNRALKEGLFDEVVMAVVSQSVEKLKIQHLIAEPLGLKFGDDHLISRANVLRMRLRGNKRSLLVLDDVWESLDLEELGIPCEDGCTVLVTSRNRDVLRAMDVQKVCEVKVLDEEEAWILFRGKAGICVDGPVLNPIAKDVLRECKGLPIALAAVGVALKDEEDVSIWEDALGQLRRSNPADIPSIIEQVYKPLKLSYDRLSNQNAKSIFLLCCLFPEDFEIPLKHLAYFAMGLHLFRDIQGLKEVRGRMSALVKTLKTRGLLLDGDDEGHVRMHDVARDVSIFIASEERRVKCRDCTWISSHLDGGARLLNVQPLQSCFPNLKLLLMNNKVEDQEMELDYDNLIGGSTDLNVLFIEYSLLKLLPELCSSVATLILYNCESLESIAAVGELKSLEILICRSCHSIKELPEQVRGLKRLKLLKISYCWNLKRVAGGVISSMVALEELEIVGSFDNWKGREIDEEEGGKEASLREIESLKKLRCLDIQVIDTALAAQPLPLLSPELLLQFRVRFGKKVVAYQELPKEGYERRMSLNFGDENDTEWGVLSKNIFLTHTECLSVFGCHEDFNLNLATSSSIRWLSLVYFRNKKNIASAAATFPLLEFLRLERLRHLEEIWDDDTPIPSNSFKNLKHLELDCLETLKRMGKSVLSTAKDFFLQLEIIDILHCYEMEHLLVLVPNEEEQDKENGITLSFPKLKMLDLNDLPKLRSMICGRGIESIQFPLLAEIWIRSCESLRCLVSSDDVNDDDDDSSHLFCHPKVSFGNLQTLGLWCDTISKNLWCDQIPFGFFRGLVELYIHDCSKIRRLFSSTSGIPQNLVNLHKLRIARCVEMVKVIEDEDVYPTKHSLFPSLQELELDCLPTLKCFCECDIELLSLTKLEIEWCNGMKDFISAGSLTAPALQTIRLNSRDMECIDDLNAALHKVFDENKVREAKMEARRQAGGQEDCHIL